jgi:hypothetical protein
MAKKNLPVSDVTDVVEIAKRPSAEPFEQITDGMHGLASILDVNLMADIETHKRLFKKDFQAGFESTLRIGLRLIAIKQSCEDGEFERIAEELGLSASSRKRAMALAAALADAGDKKRMEMLVAMGQTKALDYIALPLGAQEQIASDPELLRESIEASSREFKRTIQALKEENTLLQKQIETRNNLDLARQKSLAPARIPFPVQDVRREAAALFEKARLSIQSLLRAELSSVCLRLIRCAQPW